MQPAAARRQSITVHVSTNGVTHHITFMATGNASLVCAI